MEFHRLTFQDQPYLYVEKTTSYEKIADAMGDAFGTIFGFVGEQGIKPLSAPMSIYLEMPNGPELTFRGAVFVSAEDAAKASGAVAADKIPAGDAMHTVHEGSYMDMHKSHGALWKHLEENGIEGAMPVWEIYVTDPGETNEADLRTELYRAIAG